MAGPNSTTRIQGASLETEGRRKGIAAQAAATLVDATPRYLPDSRDSTLDGLIHGLKALNPALEQYQKSAEDEASAKGARQAATGQELDDGAGRAQAEAFLNIRGMQGGQEDLASFIHAFNTEFDKDGGDFEQFRSKFFADKTQGLASGTYSNAYTRVIAGGLEKVKADLAEHRAKAHVATIESTGLQLLDTGVKSAVAAGQPISQEYISSVEGELGKLNISGERFKELLFDSLSRHAQDGNFGIFEALKANRPDGTPGMYFDPKWKAKIDAAEVHAQSTFLTKKKQAEELAKKDREERQETAMYGVMTKLLMDGDAAGAQADFNAHVKAGLFTRATDLLHWNDKLAKAVNREARADQLETEGKLQLAIVEGKAGVMDIFRADITPSQRRSLMGEVSRMKSEARADAREARAAAREARAGEDGSGIFKTPAYKQMKEYLGDTLVPTDSAILPDSGSAGRVKRARAEAIQEAADRMRSATPDQIPAIRDDIAKRWAPRINEAARGAPGHTLARFRDQGELAAAALAGGVSIEELQWGRANLPKRGGAQPQPAQQSKGAPPK